MKSVTTAPRPAAGRRLRVRARLQAPAMCALVLGALVPGGCAGGGAAPGAVQGGAMAPPQMSAGLPPSPGDYRIGAQDVLEISVFEVPEMTRTVQVSGEGTISFPLIGAVQAAGHTPHALETEIARRLDARYIRSPHVSVSVKEFNSQRVTVDGAVRKPGVYPLRETISLTQAVALAGGQDPETAGSMVVVARPTAGGRQIARYDIEAIRRGAVADPAIASGDSVVVETSDGKVVLNSIGKISSPVSSLLTRIP